MQVNSIAVVILNYNGAELLRRFLPSVIRYSQPAQIIVADNASTDDSRELLRNSFKEVRLIELNQNYGYSGGYNRALATVDADYYVLLNSDVEVTAGWLDPLVSLLDARPDIAAVQPKILSFHHRDCFEYAGAGGGFLDTLGYPFCRGRLFNWVEKDTGQYNDTRAVAWASGACLVIRATAYRELNGLNEDFFAHMEEIDLCWRLWRSGRKVYYCGTSAVYHVGAGTLAYGNPKKIYLNFRNNLTLLIYHLPARQLWWKLPMRVALDCLAALYFAIGGNIPGAWAVLRAQGYNLKSLTSTWQTRKRLKRSYPFNTRMLYPGFIVWDYFVRKRRPKPV